MVRRKSAKNVADNDYLYGLYNSSYLKELFIYTVQYSISCLLKQAFMKLYNNSKCMEHGGKVVLGAGASLDPFADVSSELGILDCAMCKIICAALP